MKLENVEKMPTGTGTKNVEKSEIRPATSQEMTGRSVESNKVTSSSIVSVVRDRCRKEV